MEFVKSEVVSLKVNPVYNEKWLQQKIADDPTLLGLGDLVLKDVERRQPRAGRLDLLLMDAEAATRYEVEIQLGQTDETHIIRTLEYWDIEKTRYPQYDHVAVLVAEDITSRFLNVISLFNKAIPLIAIQLQALRVGDVLTLSATTVLDLMRLGLDDEDEEPGQATDRAYWASRGSPETLVLCDAVLDLVNDVVPGGMTLNYRRQYIGLARHGIADNFVQLWPKKEHLVASLRIAEAEDLDAQLKDSGLDVEYKKRRGRYRIVLREEDIEENRRLLTEMIHRASGTPTSGD